MYDWKMSKYDFHQNMTYKNKFKRVVYLILGPHVSPKTYEEGKRRPKLIKENLE